ncbi:MAG: hypothetical protein DI628_02315 [Blastochloris viridis]|uniref:Uncharacterized protein n=1 Tax=Blastochloris viridis TaxID=1079 RepID=A0A6N4R385_BLAVI|nr:MAG: hypothetical protein DI628_02315 [Blastochloris viridis]
MLQFLKYLGAFCLLIIAASLAFCSVGVYQGVKTANRYLAGADNYTCRQFVYDLEHPETDKFAPLAIAAIAYGVVPEDDKTDERQTELEHSGLQPAVEKIYALCKDQPDSRVLNVYAASIVSGTLPVATPAPLPVQAVSLTVVSGTAVEYQPVTTE